MRCIIWGTGVIYSQNINCIKYHEILGNIQVIGVTSQMDMFTEILGYPYVCKENIPDVSFDLIIVMAEKTVFQEIKREAIELGISEEKIISYRILALPQIDLQKYIEIKRNPPTIFANNCWGGLTYHQLGLEFNSPLINMFETDEDYLKLLDEPHKYMNSKLIHVEDRFEPLLKRYYPVCSCDDILLYFNHYTSFKEANECWERRKKRINWDNLFVMMLTEDEDSAIRFSKLSYEKRICFVPFDLKVPSLAYIDFYNEKTMSGYTFSKLINGMASGANLFYNPIELLYGCNVVSMSK